MKYVFIIVIVCFSTIKTIAQTFSWSGYTAGSTTYTTGAMTSTVTSSAPGFQNTTPRHYAAATVGSGQCGIAGGLALEHLFGNITSAHATVTLNFTSGGTTTGLCSVITFPIRDINADESTQTFADWVEISAIDGNNVAIPVGSITASGGSNKTITTSGSTRIIKGYNGSYGSRGSTTCDNVNISVTPPVGVAVKTITIKYHPDYTASPNNYWNFSGPLRPAYQYISIGSITATPTGSCVPLPVGLSSFSAKRIDRNVQLNWVTETEIDNDYFIVQRTNDGEIYENIAIVNAKGSPSEATQYAITDENNSILTSYYRLVQIDKNGTPTYYDLISATPFETTELLQDVYPNPTSHTVTYPLISNQSQVVNIMLLDNLGRTIKTITHQLEKGTYFPTLDMSELKTGTYQLIAISETGEKMVRIVQKLD